MVKAVTFLPMCLSGLTCTLSFGQIVTPVEGYEVPSLAFQEGNEVVRLYALDLILHGRLLGAVDKDVNVIALRILKVVVGGHLSSCLELH